MGRGRVNGSVLGGGANGSVCGGGGKWFKGGGEE